jgi:hypothetical protein
MIKTSLVRFFSIHLLVFRIMHVNMSFHADWAN